MKQLQGRQVHLRVRGERYEYPLFATLAACNKQTVAAILNVTSVIRNGIDIQNGLQHRKDFEASKHQTPLTLAAKTGRLGILQLLLEAGIGVDQKDSQNFTALSQALEESQHEAVARLFIENGADIHQSFRHGETPFIRASRNGHKDLVRLLIDRGVMANGDNGDSALLQALENGHEGISRLLIENGANVNVIDSNGRPPLSQAFERGESNEITFWASRNGYENLVKILIDKGVVTHGDDGDSALLQALEIGHESISRLLIENGANVNFIDFTGRNLFCQVSAKGHEAVARLLINIGANANAIDVWGNKPLPRASQYGHEAVVRLLINNGANVNAMDVWGYTPILRASRHGHEAIRGTFNPLNKLKHTPLSLASKYGHDAVVRLLIENGGQI
ncbi:hypothetical protein N7493_006527 [Penicillium malachiteum]|uniref:Uncharacterized protein n=1 Tax=Penicillium malachiteum TaxID=1324776 RepID=A0AAD6HKQ9_9EURO|nr:hypothetical protein N7493_006527 [Penicillium malachiteum]